jgi:hypothetical protein
VGRKVKNRRGQGLKHTVQRGRIHIAFYIWQKHLWYKKWHLARTRPDNLEVGAMRTILKRH